MTAKTLIRQKINQVRSHLDELETMLSSQDEINDPELTTEEAAELCKYSPGTLANMCRDKRLPARKAGPRKWLIRKSAILSLG